MIYYLKFIILSNQKRHDQEVTQKKKSYNVFEIDRKEKST